MSFITCQLCKEHVGRKNYCEVCELHWKLFDAEAKNEKLKQKTKN